jgi:hypothetical protein
LNLSLANGRNLFGAFGGPRRNKESEQFFENMPNLSYEFLQILPVIFSWILEVSPTSAQSMSDMQSEPN